MIESPSITISENDFSIALINPYRNIAIYAGNFEKGPIKEPYFISTIKEFISVFGPANENNYNDWYQVYNYLSYTSGIWVTRCNKEESTYASSSIGYFNNKGEFGNSFIVKILKTNSTEKLNKTEEDSKYIAYMDGYTYVIYVYKNDVLLETFYANNISSIESNYIIFESLIEGIHEFSGGLSIPGDDQDIWECYEKFQKDNYEVDIIIGNEQNNQLAIDLAEHRKDCIAFIGLPTRYYLMLLVNDLVLKTEDDKIIILDMFDIPRKFSEETKKKIFDYIYSLTKSEYCFFTLGFKLQHDKYSDSKKIINIAGDSSGLKGLASVKNPWSVGAGVEKGKLKKYAKTFYNLEKSLSDEFYKDGVNVISNNRIMSQKLFINKQKIVNKVYVRNMLNFIERSAEKLMRKYAFEFNQYSVRTSIASELRLLLQDIKASRGITSGFIDVKPDENDEKKIIINIFINFSNLTEKIQLNITNAGTRVITQIL